MSLDLLRALSRAGGTHPGGTRLLRSGAQAYLPAKGLRVWKEARVLACLLSSSECPSSMKPLERRAPVSWSVGSEDGAPTPPGRRDPGPAFLSLCRRQGREVVGTSGSGPGPTPPPARGKMVTTAAEGQFLWSCQCTPAPFRRRNPEAGRKWGPPGHRRGKWSSAAPGPALPWGLLAWWPLGLTLCSRSQPGLQGSVSVSGKQVVERSGLARMPAQSQGAPPPTLGTRALGQAGALELGGGGPGTGPPAASVASDLLSLSVRTSIRCFRMLAMVSRACSRACLYQKCRGPGVPRRSDSSGSRQMHSPGLE